MVRKFIISFILLLSFVIIFTACASVDTGDTNTPTNSSDNSDDQYRNIADAFTERFSSGVTIPELIDINEPYIPEVFKDSWYGISMDDIEDYVIMELEISFNAWVITVYKMKDSSRTQEELDAAKRRAQNMITSFEDYMPEQYEIAKRYKAIEKNGYILLAIGDDSDKAEEIFLDLLK